MSLCINKNSAEFQTLLKKSGLPDYYIAAVSSEYLEQYNRFPYLDEIKGVNSKPYLSEILQLKNNSTKIDNILQVTGKETIEESKIYLNNNFQDLEIDIMPLQTEALVNITNRPVTKKIEPNLNINHSTDLSNELLFEQIIYKLKDLYGIKLNQITCDKINNSDLANIPGIMNSKAFVHNGEIYINTEFADRDAPVHEMMHILMGSIRTSNPDLYFNITNSIIGTSIFEENKFKYPNRTINDTAEEIFIEQFAKLVSLKNDSLKDIPDNIKHELFYHAKRVLDTILMGESSIKDYADNTVFNSSLSELGALVNSTFDVNDFKGTISIENGGIHRLLANKKQELMENNELEEICNG